MTVTLPHCTDPSGVHFTPSLATIIPGEPQTITAELCVPIVPTGTADSYLKVLLEKQTPRLSIRCPSSRGTATTVAPADARVRRRAP